MMKMLVTGFDPFGEDTMNPSSEVLNRLDEVIGDTQVITSELPTVFGLSAQRLIELIDLYEPDVVLCIGQAGGRQGISIERVAINLDDARIADNQGNQPIDERIQIDGDNAYFTNLPVKLILKQLQAAGFDAEVSNSAGTFVCNHLMYQLLYYLNKKNKKIKGGFVHIPYLPEQVIPEGKYPSMPLEKIKEAITIIIQTLGDHSHRPDIKIVGGTLH